MIRQDVNHFARTTILIITTISKKTSQVRIFEEYKQDEAVEGYKGLRKGVVGYKEDKYDDTLEGEQQTRDKNAVEGEPKQKKTPLRAQDRGGELSDPSI